jgi:tetratricopeptide (TPR) repeat protein
MADKGVEELKRKGNGYITSKPPQYEKAVEAYTEALSLDPTHHAVLSNRSLAYYKLGQYKSALLDAENSISASPSWAKGYLRKCAALNMLQKHTAAQAVAEMGFRLMHSTALCRDFVFQWLKACEALYAIEKLPSLLPPGAAELCEIMISHWIRFRSETSADQGATFLPSGLVILSKQYWEIFFHCLANRTSPSLALTHELTLKHLTSIADEFTRILGLFGHSVGTSLKDWVSSIMNDPTTSTELRSQESPQIITYLKSDLHETLYPLACSLFALAVTVVCTRVYTLNSANTGFESINAMLQACLVLFDYSILGTKEYVSIHLKVLTGLVDSYNRKYAPINDKDCADIIKHCKTIESLLPTYAKSCSWEYKQMVGGYEKIIATAKGLVLARQTGAAIPFQGLPDQPQQMTLASALRDVEKHPAQVRNFATRQFQDVLSKPRTMVSLQDGEVLVELTGKDLLLGVYTQCT